MVTFIAVIVVDLIAVRLRLLFQDLRVRAVVLFDLFVVLR